MASCRISPDAFPKNPKSSSLSARQVATVEVRTALRGDADYNAITRLVGPQGLMRWTPDYTNVVPNVAESWTANADNSEYTFKLRRGMRWSDGEPFNADDILFAMNDIVANKQFFSTPPARYVVSLTSW